VQWVLPTVCLLAAGCSIPTLPASNALTEAQSDGSIGSIIANHKQIGVAIPGPPFNLEDADPFEIPVMMQTYPPPGRCLW